MPQDEVERFFPDQSRILSGMRVSRRGEYVRYSDYAALLARAEAAEAERDEARRRRDEWRKKAAGIEAMERALREKIGNPPPPQMSRFLWAGLAAAETRRADAAEAQLREARMQAISDDAQEQMNLEAAHAKGREEALREAAALIENHSEWVRSSDNSRNLQKRSEGDLLGLGYAAAILALIEKPDGG